MHYCEEEIQGMVLEECGQLASVKMQGVWYCEEHADAMERNLIRWSDPEWIAEKFRQLEEP